MVLSLSDAVVGGAGTEDAIPRKRRRANRCVKRPSTLAARLYFGKTVSGSMNECRFYRWQVRSNNRCCCSATISSAILWEMSQDTPLPGNRGVVVVVSIDGSSP